MNGLRCLVLLSESGGAGSAELSDNSHSCSRGKSQFLPFTLGNTALNASPKKTDTQTHTHTHTHTHTYTESYSATACFTGSKNKR